jgi:hypothetical protein
MNSYLKLFALTGALALPAVTLSACSSNDNNPPPPPAAPEPAQVPTAPTPPASQPGS